MHEKILNFILLNTMHMVMIHLILLREVAEEDFWTLNNFYCFSTTSLMLDDASLDHVLLPLFPCPPNPPLLLSHQGPPVSIICTKCLTHLWISLPLPPGHPSISHLCTFPWSPATSQKPGHRAQVISSPLMLPICANKLGHAILSNSISR